MTGLYKGYMGNGTSEEQVVEAIQNGAILVDVRAVEDFEAGSIDAAINIPVAKLSGGYSTLKSDQTIIVFCNTGNKAAQAKHLLEQKGFRKVINGGVIEDVLAVYQSSK